MQEKFLSLRFFLFTVIISSLILILLFFLNYFDKSTTVVFCDVGQGDGAYIRVRNRFDIVIDAGPDRKMLSCLGKYMPFYDHKIELAFLSHPQKDHYGGFIPILDHYAIQTFVLSPINNPNHSFDELKSLLVSKKISIQPLYSGDSISILDARISFLWPEKVFIQSHTKQDFTRFQDATVDLNEFSQIFRFDEKDTAVVFTGDIDPKIENLYLIKSYARLLKEPQTILKVPHHGSKNGLTRDFLKVIDPEIAVISVGKNNSYGHPSKEILGLLKSSNIQIRQTDKEGDIVYKF